MQRPTSGHVFRPEYTSSFRLASLARRTIRNASTSKRGPVPHLRGGSACNCYTTYKFLISIFGHPTYEQDARARTDTKNPFHRSRFHGSTPCFKGATSTRSAQSIHFLHFFAAKMPSVLFHGALAHSLSASIRACFRGKTQFLTCLGHCAVR